MIGIRPEQIDGGLVQSVVAGTNVTVDATDPANPVISATGGGGGGGTPALYAVVAATASTFNSAGQSPDKAFDPGIALSGGTKWLTAGVATGWLRAELNSAVAINRYTVGALTDTGNTNRNPKDWTLEGSNDGSTWTTLDTQTGQTGWTVGTTRSFTFTNTTAYLYYRFNISANNGGAYTGVSRLFLGAVFLKPVIP